MDRTRMGGKWMGSRGLRNGQRDQRRRVTALGTREWAGKLEGGHSIDDVTLGVCLGNLRLYHIF